MNRKTKETRQLILKRAVYRSNILTAVLALLISSFLDAHKYNTIVKQKDPDQVTDWS